MRSARRVGWFGFHLSARAVPVIRCPSVDRRRSRRPSRIRDAQKAQGNGRGRWGRVHRQAGRQAGRQAKTALKSRLTAEHLVDLGLAALADEGLLSLEAGRVPLLQPLARLLDVVRVPERVVGVGHVLRHDDRLARRRQMVPHRRHGGSLVTFAASAADVPARLGDGGSGGERCDGAPSVELAAGDLARLVLPTVRPVLVVRRRRHGHLQGSFKKREGRK